MDVFHVCYYEYWRCWSSVISEYIVNDIILSGSVTRFLRNFYHESNPSGPLINRLKWFLLQIRFRGDIREISDSAQVNIAWSKTLRRLTLRGVDSAQANPFFKTECLGENRPQHVNFSKTLRKSKVG